MSAGDARERSGAGPVAAFDAQRLQRVLAAAVRRVCPGWLGQQREDIVQNAIVRVVRKWGAGEEPEALGSSYLWRVAHSAVMDEIRHRHRHPEDTWDEPPDPPVSGHESPERRRQAAELRGAVSSGLAQLPEDRRRAVTLFLLGHGLQESATLLGWPVKRVDNLRYRGLAALRRYLSDRGYAP